MFNTELGGDFWRFRIGQIAADLASTGLNFMLAWWVLAETGSAAAMALILTPYMLTNLISTPLLAPLGDRFNRRWLMLCGNAGHILVLLALACLLIADWLNISMAIGLMVLMALCGSLFGAGSGAVLPQLVGKAQVVAANSQIQALKSISLLGGGLLAAFLMQSLGVRYGMLSLVGLLVLSWLGVWSIKANCQPERDAELYSINLWRRDLMQGIAMCMRFRVIFVLAMVFSLANFFLAPLSILLPYLVQSLGLSSWHLGWLQTGTGLGMIAGALSLGVLRKALSNAQLMGLGLSLVGVAPILAGTMKTYGFVFVMVWLCVLGATWLNIVVNSQITLALPDQYRTRVLSLVGLTAGACAPLSIALSGLVIDNLGPWILLLIMGIGVSLASFALLVVKHLGDFLNAEGEELSHWLGRAYPSVDMG